MKNLGFITFIIPILISLNVKSQNKTPFGLFPSCENTINGIAIGLFDFKDDCITNINGVRLELVGLGVGIGFAGYSPSKDTIFALEKINSPNGIINGLNISLFGSIIHDDINGITIGGFSQILNKVNGIMITLGANLSNKFRGAQFSFMGNDAMIAHGLQLSLISNSAKELKGIQIGLINKVEKLKGIQIGLWNINQKRKLPIINWN